MGPIPCRLLRLIRGRDILCLPAHHHLNLLVVFLRLAQCMDIHHPLILSHSLPRHIVVHLIMIVEIRMALRLAIKAEEEVVIVIEENEVVGVEAVEVEVEVEVVVVETVVEDVESIVEVEVVGAEEEEAMLPRGLLILAGRGDRGMKTVVVARIVVGDDFCARPLRDASNGLTFF